jgi:hypothetical protein
MQRLSESIQTGSICLDLHGLLQLSTFHFRLWVIETLSFQRGLKVFALLLTTDALVILGPLHDCIVYNMVNAL